METHKLNLSKHCRICGAFFSSRARSKHSLTDVFAHKDLSVSWNELWDELYDTETQEDDLNIHPTHFCTTCRTILGKHIADPGYKSELIIAIYEPHSEPDCNFCNKHVKGKAGGRPKKGCRGRQKASNTLANVAAIDHAYTRPPQPKPCPALELAREIRKLQSSSNVNNTTQDPSSSTDDVMSTDAPITPTTRRSRGPGVSKTPVQDLPRRSQKRRAEPFYDLIHKECQRRRENEDEMLKFIHNDLHTKYATDTPKYDPVVCLAKKVRSRMTDAQYRSFTYDNPNLQPLSAINRIEPSLMPGSVDFTLQSPSPCFPSEDHLTPSEKVKPINVMDALATDHPAVDAPNMLAQRYRYDKAIAKTLAEHEATIDDALTELSQADIPDEFEAIFKDGGDGLGEVSTRKAKGMAEVPDHAFRYSFTLLEISFVSNNTKYIVFKEPKPNSTNVTRPLLVAVADENDHESAAVCILPIEKEKLALCHNVITVGKYSFKIHIRTTMYDEKLQRHFLGLDTSGSNYGCTMCDFNRGTFNVPEAEVQEDGSTKYVYQDPIMQITKSFESISLTAMQKSDNDRSLGKEDMGTFCKGVRTFPDVHFTPTVDATHADINISGNMFKKILEREVAEVSQWNETQDVKDKLKIARSKLDASIRQHIGPSSEKKIMRGGNYGRDLISDNITHVIDDLITCPERRQCVKRLIDLYVKLRTVWRSNDPKVEQPHLLAEYDSNVIEMVELIRSEFSYLKRWPNYLHKICAHVKDIIMQYDSVGAYSTEGSEGSNHIHRDARVHHSRQNVQFETADILRWSWLLTSPTLLRLSDRVKKIQLCSICRMEGHNKTRCPDRASVHHDNVDSDTDID